MFIGALTHLAKGNLNQIISSENYIRLGDEKMQKNYKLFTVVPEKVFIIQNEQDKSLKVRFSELTNISIYNNQPVQSEKHIDFSLKPSAKNSLSKAILTELQTFISLDGAQVLGRYNVISNWDKFKTFITTGKRFDKSFEKILNDVLEKFETPGVRS
ncbi:MAG: hypothetical protein QNJ31_00610 [Candidatus Caenarcaniphilales bacterium]|nr:hypothetical protein [Candidatus Caenarcaniphilales bacterium]